jgi:sigma-B regulation protein RsbU (phosphoserine phosphatase)
MTDQPAPQNLSPEHLLTLYQITSAMNSSLDFDVVLNNVMEAVLVVTKGQRGFLMIADDDGKLETLVVRGLEGEKLEEEGYSTTIVNEVVSSRQPLLTNNAQFDDRYQAGQSIIMRGLRAILCAPMVVKDRLVGVVYVDTSMRAGNFSPADRDLLSAVAGQAGIALENARLYTVAVEKGRLEKELQMASEIQQSLLPQKMPNIEGYEIAPYWKAARETAGDFYDAFAVDGGRFGIVVADVSDNGAPAAFFMAVARTMSRSKARGGLSPLETSSRTNDLILEDAESGMFVTIYHSHFEVGGHGYHVNAGHNPPMYYHSDSGEVEMLPRGGRAVGWFPDNPLEEIQIDMSPGDFIVYYTDGLTEAENSQKEAYGEERLGKMIVDNADNSARDLLDIIVQDVDTFCAGEPPFDDMTLMIVRYTG